MTDPTGAKQPARSPQRPTPLGVYDREEPRGPTRFDVFAVGLSALWLVLSATFLFLTAPGSASESGASTLGTLRLMVAFLAVVLPIGLLWLAAATLRAAQEVRTEGRRLQAAVDAMRHAYLAQSQSKATGDETASVARKLDEIAAATRKTETVLATFSTRRDTAPDSAPDPAPEPQVTEEQAAFTLATPSEDSGPPLETDDFLRALNFPLTAEDKAGFAALRRAMQDRTAAHLIQAAQDALTLLSQDGIYMDDLEPDRARADVWRQFGKGVRGREIAQLGGIRDPEALATVMARMKQDPIFRDTAHHFLRSFDKTFALFEEVASDAEIQALAETRTARAFMLLGRVAGTFD